LKVLRALKDEASTASIPVIVLSARANSEDIEEGWQAGADFYLTKPFHMDQLLDVIRELTGASASA
jgi:DNA-binding response OmpR family regulator